MFLIIFWYCIIAMFRLWKTALMWLSSLLETPSSSGNICWKMFYRNILYLSLDLTLRSAASCAGALPWSYSSIRHRPVPRKFPTQVDLHIFFLNYRLKTHSDGYSGKWDIKILPWYYNVSKSNHYIYNIR